MRQDLQQSRIGDAERDDAVDRLSNHFVAGRLDLDEFEERCARSCAPRRKPTWTKLSSTCRDLVVPSAPDITHHRVIRRRSCPRSLLESPSCPFSSGSRLHLMDPRCHFWSAQPMTDRTASISTRQSR